MNISGFQDLLNRCDDQGAWAFSTAQLRALVGEQSEAFRKTLRRAEKSGAVLKLAHGLYSHPRSRNLPLEPLTTIASLLRPWDTNVLSLESVLSEAGWMSQIPGRLTLVTTGREGTFETPMGTIEFVHTARSPEALAKGSHWDPVRKIYVATPEQAYADLRHVRRNLDLVTRPEES